jgi:hypothetical protein
MAVVMAVVGAVVLAQLVVTQTQELVALAVLAHLLIHLGVQQLLLVKMSQELIGMLAVVAVEVQAVDQH